MGILVLQERKARPQQLRDQQVLREILVLLAQQALQVLHLLWLVLLVLQEQLVLQVQQQMSYIHFYLEPFSKLKHITKGK
jgi:hypothetical protein